METPKLKVTGLGYSYPDGNQALDNFYIVVYFGYFMFSRCEFLRDTS